MKTIVPLLLLSCIVACVPGRKLQQGQSARATDFVSKEIFKGKVPAEPGDITETYGKPSSIKRETVKPFDFEGEWTETETWGYPYITFLFFADGAHLLLANTIIAFDLPTLKSLKRGQSFDSVVRKMGKDYYTWQKDDYRYFIGDAELVLKFNSGKLDRIVINHLLE